MGRSSALCPDARANEPDLSPDEIMELVGDNADVPLRGVHAALGYYGEHPEEIDDSIAEAEEAEARAQRALERTVGLLGCDAAAARRDALTEDRRCFAQCGG